jgi:RHS repeat-associated protein
MRLASNICDATPARDLDSGVWARWVVSARRPCHIHGVGTSCVRPHHTRRFRRAGGGMRCYGYRYMAPELGRWLNRDPVGINGGANSLAALRNDCICNIDMFGTETWLSFYVKAVLYVITSFPGSGGGWQPPGAGDGNDEPAPSPPPRIAPGIPGSNTTQVVKAVIPLGCQRPTPSMDPSMVRVVEFTTVTYGTYLLFRATPQTRIMMIIIEEMSIPPGQPCCPTGRTVEI